MLIIADQFHFVNNYLIIINYYNIVQIYFNIKKIILYI